MYLDYLEDTWVHEFLPFLVFQLFCKILLDSNLFHWRQTQPWLRSLLLWSRGGLVINLFLFCNKYCGWLYQAEGRAKPGVATHCLPAMRGLKTMCHCLAIQGKISELGPMTILKCGTLRMTLKLNAVYLWILYKIHITIQILKTLICFWGSSQTFPALWSLIASSMGEFSLSRSKKVHFNWVFIQSSHRGFMNDKPSLIPLVIGL